MRRHRSVRTFLLQPHDQLFHWGGFFSPFLALEVFPHKTTVAARPARRPSLIEPRCLFYCRRPKTRWPPRSSSSFWTIHAPTQFAAHQQTRLQQRAVALFHRGCGCESAESDFTVRVWSAPQTLRWPCLMSAGLACVRFLLPNTLTYFLTTRINQLSTRRPLFVTFGKINVSAKSASTGE